MTSRAVVLACAAERKIQRRNLGNAISTARVALHPKTVLSRWRRRQFSAFRRLLADGIGGAAQRRTPLLWGAGLIGVVAAGLVIGRRYAPKS